jgi:hypothetical protein
MKKLVFLFVSLFVILISAQNAKAQPGASADGTASATILTPIEIEAVNELKFGSIAAGQEESEVEISIGGARNKLSGDADLYTSEVGQPGTFLVKGAANHTYAITLPADETVTLTGAGTAMKVKTFKSNPENTGTLTGGNQTINVGATLVVGASQTAGSYTGTYTVKVNYN